MWCHVSPDSSITVKMVEPEPLTYALKRGNVWSVLNTEGWHAKKRKPRLLFLKKVPGIWEQNFHELTSLKVSLTLGSSAFGTALFGLLFKGPCQPCLHFPSAVFYSRSNSKDPGGRDAYLRWLLSCWSHTNKTERIFSLNDW